MRLIECYVSGFGRLKETRYTFDDGLNCIYGPNGSGKTTLTYFITAMLYGLGESRKSSLEENDRKRFLPWGGGPFGGSLTFFAMGKRMRIERSFGSKASEDKVFLYDDVSGAAININGDTLGESLFGINRGGFERTVFLSERSLSDNIGAGGVSAKLSSLSGVEGDLSEVWNALDTLDDRRKFYYKRGGSGEIAEIDAKIAECDAQLAELERKQDLLNICRENLSVAEGVISERKAEHLTRQAEADAIDSRYRDTVRRLEEQRSALAREIEYFGGEIPDGQAILKENGRAKTARHSGLGKFFVVSGVILTLIGIALGFILLKSLFAVSAIGAVLLLCGIIVLISCKKNAKEVSCADTELLVHLKEYRFASESISRLEAECEKLRTYQKAATPTYDANSKSHDDRLGGAMKDAALLSARCEALEAELLRRDEIADRVALLRQKRDKYAEELRIIKLTSMLLRRAYDNLTERYLGVTRERFSHYASLISGEAGEYYIDTDFNLQRREGALTHTSKAYSKGTRELYALALRLALIDALYKDGDTPPIILDDPFSLFDDERLGGAGALIKSLSKTKQIIYMTPHKSRIIK